jgi:hypothetical protein
MSPSVPRLSPIVWGLLGFAAGFTVYSATIILTTPNLSAPTSLWVAFNISPQIMLGVPAGLGIQAYLVSYAKRLPCPVGGTRQNMGGTAIGSVPSALFSFFGLTQVGCCTFWLFFLSILPSVVGVGAAGFLISYGFILSNVSLVLVAIPIVLLIHKIRSNTVTIGAGSG